MSGLVWKLWERFYAATSRDIKPLPQFVVL
jgi:hypothetical protein